MYRRLCGGRVRCGQSSPSVTAPLALRLERGCFASAAAARAPAPPAVPLLRFAHRTAEVGLTSTSALLAVQCTPHRALFSFSRAQRQQEGTNDVIPASTSTTAAPAASQQRVSSESAAAVASSSTRAAASHAAAQAGIEEELQTLRGSYLEPYDGVYRFLTPFKSTTPMVMLLGNHSSGKSTLINYLSGREIQETGVAPTDDGFTVIKRDTYDMDADGPSIVSNPKYQYQSLQQFGFAFVTHFKMKTRTMPATSQIPMDMVLVDTPGMIDTPVHAAAETVSTGNGGRFGSISGISSSSSSGDHTRGYDFLAVTRWFAQQSDVILLMFDPANPGTTGETLDVLTKSLTGYEHKFFLVMNKADVFEKVTDFARAYGTLCWNLSKVMKMKDIPRVYTTCTPLEKRGTHAASATTATTGTVPADELARQRNEILHEIRAAPMRRMDNLITETEESARNLLLACRAAKLLRQEYRQRELLVYGVLGAACLVGPAVTMALSSVSITGTVLVALLSVAMACGGLVAARMHLQEQERRLLLSCDNVLGRLFTTRTLTKDVEVRWARAVKPELLRIATVSQDSGASGIMALPTCSARACRGMQYVIDQQVPTLRRKVSEYKETYFRTQRSSNPEGKGL